MPPATSRAGAALKERLASEPLTLTVFTVSLLVSALLLFAVQPMFAKMVLPRLGGSPAVWSVAMCFFQAALLAGYAYAHVLMRAVRPGTALLVHMGVMSLALLALPLGIASGWGRPPEEGLHLWALGLFTASIGLPFFALAGNAPLLQAWFARTGHPHAHDPYFLYGASNLGSLLALLAYPVVIEPGLALAAQADMWSAGYALLMALVAASGMLMLVAMRPGDDAAPTEAQAHRPLVTGWPAMSERLAWTGLAFVPSGLLVAVTSHITTDVAAAPFLWVAPLALYLLTFVITFQRRPVIPHRFMLAAQPVAVAVLVASLFLPLKGGWPVSLSLHLLAFFVSAMVCHGVLVSRRPPSARLTEFYLCMAFGGALGGLFAGLIAPQVFSTVLEYPLLIVLALLARPGMWSSVRGIGRGALWGVAILSAAMAPAVLFGTSLFAIGPLAYVGVILGLAGLVALSRTDAPRLFCVAAAAMACGLALKPDFGQSESFRSFFGVHRVIDRTDAPFRVLMHGTTLHGAERIGPGAGSPPEPLSYYHRAGPFADVIAAMRAEERLETVAAVGLGTGSLACYKQPHETWRFFEIDAMVVRIARNPAYFTFLSECAPESDIVVGDARLTLEDEAASAYDLMIIDAFSSDAIPVHLMTLEALRLYIDKLRPGGLVALHISNRNMDLAPVLASAARELGLAGTIRRSRTVGDLAESMKAGAVVAVLARTPADLGALAAMDGWQPLPAPTLAAWTDDYSNVLAAIRARFLGTSGSAADQGLREP